MKHPPQPLPSATDTHRGRKGRENQRTTIWVGKLLRSYVSSSPVLSRLVHETSTPCWVDTPTKRTSPEGNLFENMYMTYLFKREQVVALAKMMDHNGSHI